MWIVAYVVNTVDYWMGREVLMWEERNFHDNNSKPNIPLCKIMSKKDAWKNGHQNDNSSYLRVV